MGLPLFENPHLLPQTTEHATRAQLFSIDDDETIHRDSFVDEEAMKKLDKQLRKRVRYEIVLSTSQQSPKRKKLEDSDEHGGMEPEEQFVLFRLVSSLTEPRLVSLLPAPSPPTLTRPPDSEDSEVQAAIRKHRAEAASIDGHTILQCASISQPPTSATFASVRLHDAMPNPPYLMVLEQTQKLRKTRPPVPTSKLLYFPYTADTLLPSPTAAHKTKCLVMAIEEAESGSTCEPSHRRSRHRRKSKIIAQPPKNRPPPQFWRPSPEMKGKSRGYAFGYPGSLLAAAEARGHVDERSAQRYKHDTMQKARYAE